MVSQPVTNSLTCCFRKCVLALHHIRVPFLDAGSLDHQKSQRCQRWMLHFSRVGAAFANIYVVHVLSLGCCFLLCLRCLGAFWLLISAFYGAFILLCAIFAFSLTVDWFFLVTEHIFLGCCFLCALWGLQAIDLHSGELWIIIMVGVLWV